MVLNQGNFALAPPRAHLAISRDTLSCLNLGECCLCVWVKARGVAKHLTMHSSVPWPPNTHNKELSNPNVNSTEVEKPWSRGSQNPGMV